MPQPILLPGDNATDKFLDEDQVGVSTSKIGFPNIRGCQGVVCVLDNGAMVGGHFTSGGTEQAMANKIKDVMNDQFPGAKIAKMFVAYNSQEKYSSGGDVRQKADLLGFKGKAQFFDTNKMDHAKQDGTYVEVASKNGSHELNYKRNTKMQYGEGPEIGSHMNQTVRAALAASATKMHHGASKTTSVKV